MKVAIFGGSFDPVHLGHVSLAEEAVKQMNLDKVIFMPANLQPFKLDAKMADFNDRMKMISLAIKEKEGFEVSDFESTIDGTSYTYLTLEKYKKKIVETENFLNENVIENTKPPKAAGEVQLFFLCGTDTFIMMEKWKKINKLLTDTQIIVGRRPGYREEELLAQEKKLKDKFGAEIHLINNNLVNISATELRKEISEKRKGISMLNSEVEEYIYKRSIY
ncbi:MAG: nicotinate (nicotinamide) nucleotide adenylyltransferase [Anaerovoracaceae bacterium]